MQTCASILRRVKWNMGRISIFDLAILKALWEASHKAFKFVKGHLHIKSFYGSSRNAVYTQIWIAVCDYLLLVIAKKMFHIDCDLYILAQSIGLVLFEKEPINEIFKRNKSNKNVRNDGQLYLWPDFSGQ